MPLIVSKADDLRSSGALITVRIGPPDLQPSIEPVTVTALLDTGSDWTVLQEGIATSLGLEPAGRMDIQTARSVYHDCAHYWVFVQFPAGKPFKVCAIEAPFLSKSAPCRIGRDILSQSTLTYDGLQNTFSLVLWG